MKLIVGLGNPGEEYDKTHHNVGFFFLDSYAKYHNIDRWYKKFDALISEFNFFNEKIILLKPLTYMNLSGNAVKKCLDYYKISVQDTIIISDDLDLPVGSYRLKQKGSSGGHNGLKNIEQLLNTDEYKRLKIGILGNHSNSSFPSAKDYVLSKISNDDLKTFENMQDVINQILDSFIVDSFDNVMNKYNHK